MTEFLWLKTPMKRLQQKLVHSMNLKLKAFPMKFPFKLSCY